MGFSSIIATGLMVIVLIVAGYLILASLDSAVSSATASQATARDAAEAQLHTSLSLSSPEPGATCLDFNVTNDGDATIDDVAGMDVFVKPIDSGIVTGCGWLPYNESADGGSDHWYVLYQAKAAPGSASSLGPGDVMRVRCVLGDGMSSNMGEITVAAPAGAIAKMLYNGPVW